MTGTEKAQTVLITSALGLAMFATLCAAVRALRPILLTGLHVLVLVLVATATASAQEPAQKMRLGTKIGLACFSVGSYWDAIQTAHCSALGRCHEANWLYRGLVARAGIVVTMTVKGGANTTAAAVVIKDSKRHPVRAMWSAIGLCGGQLAVNIANANTLKENR